MKLLYAVAYVPSPSVGSDGPPFVAVIRLPGFCRGRFAPSAAGGGHPVGLPAVSKSIVHPLSGLTSRSIPFAPVDCQSHVSFFVVFDTYQVDGNACISVGVFPPICFCHGTDSATERVRTSVAESITKAAEADTKTRRVSHRAHEKAYAKHSRGTD